MIGDVLEFEDLQRITGIEDAKALREKLEKQGVRYLKGKRNRPFCTVRMLEAGVGLGNFDPDDLHNPTAQDILG